MSPTVRDNGLIALAFVAPLGLALVMQGVGSAPAPTSVFAAPEEDAVAEAPAQAVREPSEAERRAAMFAAIRKDDPLGLAPLLYPRPAPVEAAITAEAAGSAAPAVEVKSIMAGRGGAMATVNKKLRRVGDEIAPGWTITAIDPEAGEVTIRSADGREIVARRAGS